MRQARSIRVMRDRLLLRFAAEAQLRPIGGQRAARLAVQPLAGTGSHRIEPIGSIEEAGIIDRQANAELAALT